MLQLTPVPLPRILVTPLHLSGGPYASGDRDAAGTPQHGSEQEQEQEQLPSLHDWACQQAVLLPPLVGLLHSYTHLCDVRLPCTKWYHCLPRQQHDKVERDDPAAQSQHPYGPSPSQSLHAAAEECESQLVRDLDFLLPGLSLCLPREGEPQHCMLARGHGGGGHSAGAGQGQEQQQQEQHEGARDVDAEALRAVELGATLLHLRAVARAAGAATKAAGAATKAAERLQSLACNDTGGPGSPSFPADHGEPPELRFALASVGVLAAASGALLALRRALGSGRLDPARPSGLHHTTAQEVCDGLWGELRQRSAATAVSGVVDAAREAVKAAPGCPCAGGDEDAASGNSSSSRCYLGVGIWCLRHSSSYLLLLSRASRFAHDMVSLAACGGVGGSGGGSGSGGGTAGSVRPGGNSGSSSGKGSSSATAGDGVGSILHSLRLHSLLNSLASAILEVPPPPPPPPQRPGEPGAGAEGVHAVPLLCLPDDPSRNLPPHVATCLTVSICHVASCCCMLASSEVVGTDVLHAWAMEREGREAGSDGDCGLPSVVMRALSVGHQTLELLRKLQQQAAQDALGEGHQRGHTAHTEAGAEGGGSSSSSGSSSGWAALAPLRLQRRLGVWLGGRGLSVLQTGLGEAGGAVGLPGVSGSASAHPGAVRAVTHLLMVAPYLMAWAFLSQHCASGTANMAFLASVRLRRALKDCSRALHATWQLHTSHPQLRLPLPGEPLVPPAAASAANPQAATAAVAAAAAAAAASDAVGPLTLAYIAHLAIPLSTGNKWLTMLNVQDAGWLAPRLASVEMLAWALAGATVAGEAWLRLRVHGQRHGQAEDGLGAGREEGQGEGAVPAGAPVSQMLLNQVGQLVCKVRRAVFEGPDAAVKVPFGQHAYAARCLAGCRFLRSFDHAIRLLAYSQRAIATTDVPNELYAVPYFAINLWEVVLDCSSRSDGPSSFGGRVGGGGGQLPQEAAEVQVAAAKELCGLLVSHAKLVGLHKTRAQHAVPWFHSAVLACRAARVALAAGGQGREASCSSGTGEPQAWGGSGGSHGAEASACTGSCEGSGGCGAGGAEGAAEHASGTAGSSGGGLELSHGAALEGSAGEASCSAGSSGHGQGAALKLRCAVAVERALNATTHLLGEVVGLASVLALFVAMPNLDWQVSILTGKGPRTGNSSDSPHRMQPCGVVASRNPAAAPSSSSSTSSSSSAAATAVDPAVLAVLRGAVSHHAVALYGAVMAHFTLCRALCEVAFGTDLDPPPGVHRPDGLEVTLKRMRRTCVDTCNFVVGWALRTPALLLPVLTRGSLAACRVPRADAKYTSVRMVLAVCCEMAVSIGRSLTGDGGWGAAPGQGGEGARWASEGAGRPFQGATRAEADVELRSGCCAVLDCALRLAAREDTAGELVAWAQEAAGSGGAGLPAEAEAVAGPAQVEAKASKTRKDDDAGVSMRGAAGQGKDATVNRRGGADDATQRTLAAVVGTLQGALASLGLSREAKLAARLGAAAAAAGKAAAVAAGEVSEGAVCGSGGACGAEQQQQQQQQQQPKCKRIVDAFRRQARELLASYSALPSYPYTALGLHVPSSNSGGSSSSGGVQLGRGGRSKKCGKGSSKAGGGGGGGAQRQEADEAPLPVTVLPRVCCNPLCVSFEGSCEEDLWLRKCGGCLAVRYCSRGCQAVHWGAGHREECRKLRVAGWREEGLGEQLQ